MIFLWIAVGFFTSVLLGGFILAFHRYFSKKMRRNSRIRRADMIEELAKLKIYRWLDEISISDTCHLCQMTFSDKSELRILPCNHGYHVRCIDPWVAGGRLFCPNCCLEIIPNTKRFRSTDFLTFSGEEHTPLLQQLFYVPPAPPEHTTK